MVIQVRQTAPPTSTVTSDQRDSQASGYTIKDLPAIRIPRVSATESNQPQASDSSHSQVSHRDRSRSARQPVFPAESTTIRWTTPNAQPRWRAEEPESLETMEASVRQVAAGATEVAAGFMLQYLDSFWSHLNENLRLCTKDIQGTRKSAAAFGPPGPVQQLMGQIRSLWDCVSIRLNRIDALVEEKEQARSQCDQMATAQTNAQREIGQLRVSNEQLQKDNDHLRQELLAARATPGPSQPSSSPSCSSVSSGPLTKSGSYS